MPTIKPGDTVYSRRHKQVLRCIGRNGGRPEMLFGQVVKSGKPDEDTWKIFKADDVEGLMTPAGIQATLPGTVKA